MSYIKVSDWDLERRYAFHVEVFDENGLPALEVNSPNYIDWVPVAPDQIATSWFKDWQVKPDPDGDDDLLELIVRFTNAQPENQVVLRTHDGYPDTEEMSLMIVDSFTTCRGKGWDPTPIKNNNTIILPKRAAQVFQPNWQPLDLDHSYASTNWSLWYEDSYGQDQVLYKLTTVHLNVQQSFQEEKVK